MAADASLAPTSENYIGVRYKALLAEDELSETGWALLFGGSGFTNNGEYEPHFVNLMIKAGWTDLYDTGLCASGWPLMREQRKQFTIHFQIDDYEDSTAQDNDIAARSNDPMLLPLYFTNIDSTDPKAPDMIAAEYQVDKAGSLEGREVELSVERGQVVRLPTDQNYFEDPDNACKPNSQADILYRQWTVRLQVPSLGIDSSVDFYVNANQGDKINGNFYPLNFMWENYRRPAIESDRFKVIIFDPEVKAESGEWKKATRFLVDYRTPLDELPLNDKGQLIGGYRKVNYKGQPAIEASFGYGYTDYVVDGDPTNYEPTVATKGVIDLTYPVMNSIPVSSVGAEVLDAPADSVVYVLPDWQSGGGHTKPPGVGTALVSDFTALGFMYGASKNMQIMALDTNSTYFDPATGAPKIPNGVLVVFAGRGVNAVVHYYEMTGMTSPIYADYAMIGGVESYAYFDRQGVVVASMPYSAGQAGTSDRFLVEYFKDANNKVFIIYGFAWKGTYIGGVFFKTNILPNIVSFTHGWYIYRWDDTNGNGLPDPYEVNTAPVNSGD